MAGELPTSSTRRSPRSSPFQGTLAQGPERCSTRSRRWTRWARSAIASGTSRRCTTTRISATTRSTRAGSRCRSCSREQQQASSWFNPELLAIPLDDRFAAGWTANADLARLPLCDREPVSRAGARARRTGRAAAVVCRPLQQRAARQLRGADDRRHEVPVDHAGERRARSRSPTASTARCSRRIANQDDRATAYRAFHQAYADNQNTYAALYNGVLQRDWFHARARGYESTLDAALHGNNIPTSVVENLIAVTKAGRRAAAPLSPAAPPRARASTAIGCSTSSCRWSSTTRGIRTTRSARGSSIRSRRSAATYQQHVRERVRRPLDRRVREQREAQRRVLGAGVRRASVHAAQLQRDARRGVHAGARDGPLDAHAAVASDAAVRVCGLHDLRRGGAVDAERGAVPRPHARARRAAATSAPCCCSTRSTASPARSTRR